MCPSSDAVVPEQRRASSRHRPRSASARGRNGRRSGTSDDRHKSQRGSSLGQRSARSAGGSRPRKSSAERTSKRHGERHRSTRSSNAEHRDAPAVGQQKVLSLKLSRATEADHRTVGNQQRVHAAPNAHSGPSPGRRGRSATPKRRSSVEKESHSEKHKGFAGRLRSLFGHKSKRTRGKSLPSRIANLRRNRNDADSAILRQNLGVSSARSTNWVSEGTVWTEDMSRGDEATGRRQRQRRSASAGRRSRASSIGSRKSVSQRRSASAGRRSRTSSTNSRKTERLDSVRGQQKASKRRSRSRGERENKSKDPQAARNDHCREHFGASNRHRKKKSHRKSHRHHRHHNREGKEKARSKSMPALGGRQPARSVRVDPEKLKRRPVSPMASVDSSWRHKRTKKKRRAKEPRKSIEGKEAEEKERVRSKSCEPSYDFVAMQRCRRPDDSTGNEQGSRNEDEVHEEVNPGALVPFVQKQGALNFNLAYNLGEIDGAFIFGKEKEGAAVEENETSLPEPSYSSEENDASLPEPSRSSEESEKHEAASESHSERSNSSEPNMLERKPSISHESASESGTLTLGTEPNNLESKPCAGLDSSSKSDTFTVRTEPNGFERKLERQPCAGLDTSSKSDTFTFGMGTIGSGTWHGRAPDPVLSLHGDSTVLSPGGTYDNSFMSPRSGTLRSGAPAEPPMGTDSLASKTDPPATSSAALPDSFIEVASRGNEGSKKAEDSVGDREGRSQDKLDPIARDDVVNEADEGSEEGSLFDYAPSTTGTTEQKVAATSGVPPLHVSVRAKKPTGSVASSHKPRQAKRTKGSKAKKDEESKDEDVAADTPDNDGDRHDKELEECYPQHRSRNKAIKDNISEVVVEDGTDQVSAVTMPAALMKAPPMHSRIRAKKPRNRSGLSSHRENKDEEEVKDEDVGPLTGNEIDLHSNSTKEPSEITMPVALRQPFSRAQPPRLPSPLPEEEQDEEDAGPLTGNEIDLHSNSTKEPSEITMPVALRQTFSRVVQSPRLPSPLPEEEPATQHLHSEKLERPHQNLGAGVASFQQKASSPRPKKVPPPPPRPMPPPPLRSQRGDADQQPEGNSVLLEDAAAQLLSLQSGLNNWASSSAASIGTTQRSPDGRLVTNMPYTDEYHDTGLYSGETNDYGVPHGRGRMKYDQDGETLEGKWVNGVWCGPDAAQRLSSGLSAFQGGAPQARKGSVASKQSARA